VPQRGGGNNKCLLAREAFWEKGGLKGGGGPPSALSLLLKQERDKLELSPGVDVPKGSNTGFSGRVWKG